MSNPAVIRLLFLLALVPAIPGLSAAQNPAPFESAPGPTPAPHPAPARRQPSAAPQPEATPPQATAPTNLPVLDGAYVARIQQVAKAAGIAMTDGLNFRRETTPSKWWAFLGAWGPGDRISNGAPKGDRNMFVIESINSDGFADIVAGWSACCADNNWSGRPGWRRTSGAISGNMIVTDEPATNGGRVRREMELASAGQLHVKFRLPSEIIDVIAHRLK
jgi:hypothetical protein